MNSANRLSNRALVPTERRLAHHVRRSTVCSLIADLPIVSVSGYLGLPSKRVLSNTAVLLR